MTERRRGRGDLECAVRAVLADSAAPLTPAEVRERLGCGLAYTTVLTVLSRLHAKGEVTRHPAGRGYAYGAQRAQADVTAERMRRLLDADADRAGVLTRFVGRLAPEDEALLRVLLEDGAQEGGRAS